MVVLDAQGKSLPPAQLSLCPAADGRWRCDFTPPQTGLHSVNVLFDRRPIPGSPFGVKVGPGEVKAREARSDGYCPWLGQQEGSCPFKRKRECERRVG